MRDESLAWLLANDPLVKQLPRRRWLRGIGIIDPFTDRGKSPEVPATAQQHAHCPSCARRARVRSHPCE